MAITVTVAASGDGTHVELTASGGVAPYTWTAYPDSGAAYTVPNAASDPTGATTLDGLAPFGSAVTYQARDSVAAVGDSAPFTLAPLPYSVLSDALDPTRNVLCPVVSQLPNEWQGRSVWFDVLDRPDPFVAVAPMRLRGGTLVVRRESTEQRRALLALLAPGSPVVLRSPCPDAVDDVVMLPLSLAENLVLDDAPTGARHFGIQYQAVTRELGPYLPDPTWTWGDLVADPRDPTWSAVAASFATWSDVVSNVRMP